MTMWCHVPFTLVVVVVAPVLAYGLQCSQLALDTAASGTGASVVPVLNVSYAGLADRDLAQLRACVQADPGLGSLRVLDLQGNRLAGPDLAGLLDDLPNLQSLYLNRNPIEELDPSLFRRVRRLRYLDLSGTSLRTLPAGLFDPVKRSLLYLFVDETRLEFLPDDLFDAAAGPPQPWPWSLRGLSLARNRYLSRLPDDIFRQLPALQWINVSASAIRCYAPSSSRHLSRFPPSLSDCSSDVPRRRLLSLADQVFATARVVFRLDLDYTSLSGDAIANTLNGLTADLLRCAAIGSGRIVNVRLGPGTLSTTVVQLDILQDGSPSAAEVVSIIKNQSSVATSAFRTGSVTSHFVASSSIIAVPAQVRLCTPTFYVDVSESCPPSDNQLAIVNSSWGYAALVLFVVLFTAGSCGIRLARRHRSAKRLRDAMTDVVNLSLEQELAPQPSIQLYKANSPSFQPRSRPALATDYGAPPQSSSFDDDSTNEPDFMADRSKRNPAKTQSSHTLVKRPGLNAIRSKKMLLVSSVDGDESMLDTDAEF